MPRALTWMSSLGVYHMSNMPQNGAKKAPSVVKLIPQSAVDKLLCIPRSAVDETLLSSEMGIESSVSIGEFVTIRHS